MNYIPLPEEKVSVVYLGVGIEKKAEKHIEDNPYLLFVGNRTGHKNFKNFIHAYSKSKAREMGYGLVCFGGGEFTKSELELFDSLCVPRSDVRQVSGEDSKLSSYYAGAHLFCYPSIYEGFGIPPLEAMAQGCPVVCSNSSSIPEVVGDAGIYFDPLDVVEMTQALNMVLDDASLRQKIIKTGYQRVHRFTWEQCASETYKVYKKAIA